MKNLLEIKKEFYKSRDTLFSDKALLEDPFNFCVSYSLLVEEVIIRVIAGKKLSCALVSSGSFSRRELAPFSDIDVMFLVDDVTAESDNLKELVTTLWDAGVEVSHTVRDFSDIQKFLDEDLHAFTQFFETRFIFGDDKIYHKWNEKLRNSLDDNYRKTLLNEFFEDIRMRHQRYGDSAKVLEPNLKFSAGGLRDLHAVQWMYAFKNNEIINEQNELTTTQHFINKLRQNKLINPKAAIRLKDAYKMVLNVRNRLHLITGRKNDRLEFSAQEKIANALNYQGDVWQSFMHEYFRSSNILNRFSKTMMKGFSEQLAGPISDYLLIALDDDFVKKGNIISLKNDKEISLSDILRAFWYRGMGDARFDENLRSKIIETVHDIEELNGEDHLKSVFFREILKLPKNVGKTLDSMNEMGVLSAYLPEFRELVGFFQPGVYHCYTADEHTIIAIKNVELLESKNNELGKIYNSLKKKDLLFLALLFHDIAKPIDVSGHEILGAEMVATVMPGLGYSQEEVELVQFLVRYHLTMEQVAFRRNLNDPSTLNSFASVFTSIHALDLLYLVTYADLSAVSPQVWTNWKSELLYELYRKTRSMLEENLSGTELIDTETQEMMEGQDSDDTALIQHIESIDDPSYLQHFTQDEINRHKEEIENGTETPIFFRQEESFTVISMISKDSPSLLSRLCGTLTINDLNIHSAKIFTRQDGVVIDSFSVSDYRTGNPVMAEKFDKIKSDIRLAIKNRLPITTEMIKTRKKWWRIESKIFRRRSKIKIAFENHEKFTIIDVFAPDTLGLLYKVTSSLAELNLSVYYAKIATRADDVVDSFYVLNEHKKKVTKDDEELIKIELANAINEIL
ncbi:MAG: bifunctional uridylyltransferase/uridylyl-removing enzyme [Melioribacteraceae bacterium]|nr:MAG: bifunctional uridylyltransferase/uridylyl-removing enzyme [Melioribacteraceae bacterium]